MSTTTNTTDLTTADIVGIVIGSVLALATLIGLIYSMYAMCGKKNTEPQVWAQPASSHIPPDGPHGQPMNTDYYSQSSMYNKPVINYERPPAYTSVYTGDNRFGKY